MTGKYRLRIVLALACIIGLGLILRLIAVWQLGEPPGEDALEYHSIAVNLLSSFEYAFIPGHPTTFRGPAYPSFLAGIYGLSGIDYHNALILQALFHTGMIVAVFFLTVSLSQSVNAGLLASLLFALNPSFEITSRLYAENLSIILTFFFLWSTYRLLCCKTACLLPVIIAGVCAGLLGLTKPELSLLAPFMLVLCLLWKAARGHWKNCAIVAAISMLIIGSWQLRNYNIQETSGKGQADYLTWTLLDGFYYPAHTGSWWWPVTDMKEFEAEFSQYRKYEHSQPDKSLLVKELREKIRRNPIGFMKLCVSNILILWASPPVGSSFLGNISPVLKWAALAGKWIFILLALGMLALTLPKQYKLLPFLAIFLYWTGVYALIIARRRYGYPLIAEECVLVAWALSSLRFRDKTISV